VGGGVIVLGGQDGSGKTTPERLSDVDDLRASRCPTSAFRGCCRQKPHQSAALDSWATFAFARRCSLVWRHKQRAFGGRKPQLSSEELTRQMEAWHRWWSRPVLIHHRTIRAENVGDSRPSSPADGTESVSDFGLRKARLRYHLDRRRHKRPPPVLAGTGRRLRADIPLTRSRFQSARSLANPRTRVETADGC